MYTLVNFIKENWKIILLVFITPVIISQIIRIPLGHWTIAEEGAWVGFLGNYGGGILGGIIAFLVARDQMRKNSKESQIRNLAKELPFLTGIELECEKVLMQFIAIQNKFVPLLEEKDSYLFPIDALIWTRWECIDLINDPILQEELIKHYEALHRNVETFGIDVHKLESDIKDKRSIERKMNPLDRRYTEIRKELSIEGLHLEVIKEDKVHYLAELGYCIEKTQKIKENISERKRKIHEVLLRSNFYNDNLLSKPIEFKVDR